MYTNTRAQNLGNLRNVIDAFRQGETDRRRLQEELRETRQRVDTLERNAKRMRKNWNQNNQPIKASGVE